MAAVPSWCTINPINSSLMPGEKMTVYLTIHVHDPPTAASLNVGFSSREDNLILHTENGRDHFISVSATWIPSAFGGDLAVLCRLVRPVREYSVEVLKTLWREHHGVAVAPSASLRDANEGTVAATSDVNPRGVEGVREQDELKLMDASPSGLISSMEKNLSVPKELWRLVDFIYRYGMDVVSLPFFVKLSLSEIVGKII